MRFLTIIRVALRALRRNTMRSILTALGIIIGVGAVITMVSIGNGAKAQVQAQVASLGQNIITVFPNFFSAGGVRSGFGGALSLTPEDAEAIQNDVEGIARRSAIVRKSWRTARTGTRRSWANRLIIPTSGAGRSPRARCSPNRT